MNDELISDLGRLSASPLAFVLWSFPWGEGVLAGRTGPEAWQRELLTSVEQKLKTVEEAIREATSSGNGVGKSACVAWLILWAMTTRTDTRGVVTANTETQLKTKTWPELAKWFNLFIARDLFHLEATALFSRDDQHKLSWRVDAIPWSQYNAVAFQGLHNEGRRLFVIIDEASGVDDIIWEACDGCMTDASAERIWCVFGNPNLPKGRFRECFPGGRFAHRWSSRTVDSRSVSFTDHKEADNWIRDYGEDDDFVRVRVKGEFPRTGSLQFIPTSSINEAKMREAIASIYDPFVMGVDVARFGDDQTVIRFRRGRDARTVLPVKLRSADTMQIAARVVDLATSHKIDAIFVDGGGVGGGVVDRLRMLRQPVFDIQFGSKSDRGTIGVDDNLIYANKRAEMWGAVREWLKGGAIDDDPELVSDLNNVQYGYTIKDGRDAILLEKKEDMKRRGLASPDNGDALALTFAYPVQPSDHQTQLRQKPIHTYEYDPFAAARNVTKNRGIQI